MSSDSTESWWNLALLQAGSVFLFVLCLFLIYAAANNPSHYMNLFQVEIEAPRHIALFSFLWAGVTVAMTISHYEACNAGKVPYCYSFLWDIFTPLYVCLLFLGDFLNPPNLCAVFRYLILLYGLYHLLPCPITCWWLLICSILVCFYQFYAMGKVLSERSQRIGLLHMNYVLVVHWMLAGLSFPPPTGLSWGDVQSTYRNWELYIHALAFISAAGLLVMYTRHLHVKEVPEYDRSTAVV